MTNVNELNVESVKLLTPFSQQSYHISYRLVVVVVVVEGGISP